MEVASQGTVRLFTREEALQLLPSLQLGVTAIWVLRQDVEELLARLAELAPGDVPAMLAGQREPPDGAGALVERLRARLLDLGTAVDGVTGLGVLFHDLDLGLLDFPSLLDGKPAMLCWQLGETGVDWAHELGGGTAERRLLPDAHPMMQ